MTTDQTTTDQTTTDQQGDITMEMSDTAAERLSERPELSNHPAVRAARRLRRAWRYHNLQGIHASATEMIEEWSKDPVLANVHSFLEDYADIHFDDLVGFFTNIGDGANQLRILDAQYDWAGEEHQWVPIRVDDPEAIVATLRTHVPPNVLDDVVKRLVLDHFSDA